MSNSFLFELRDKLFHTSLQQFNNYVNHAKINIDHKTAENLFTALYNKKQYHKIWIDYFNYFVEMGNPEIIHVQVHQNRRILEDVLLNGRIDEFKKVANTISKYKGLDKYSLNNLIVLALERKEDEIANFINQIDNIRSQLLRGGQIGNNDQGQIFLVRYALHKELIFAALLLLNKRLGKLTSQNQEIFQICKIKLNKRQYQTFYQFIENYLQITKCNPRKINISGETFYEKVFNKDQREKIQNIIKNYEQNHPQKKEHIKRTQNKVRSSMGAEEHHKHYNTQYLNSMGKEKVIINIQSYQDELSVQKQANKLYQAHIKQKEQQMRWNKEAKSRIGIIKKQELRYYLQQDIRLQVDKMKQENQHYKQIFTEITQKIRDILNKINVQLEVFGSFKTQLCLLQSDIDIVVIPKIQPPNFDPGEFLRQISLTLVYMSQFQQVKFIGTATVPIIKITCKEQYFHKKFDITYKDKEHNGLQSVQLIKKYLDYYPQLQHLIFILKKFIYTSKLFGPYKGGLSSYGLILMIIAYIQHYYKQCERQNKDISQILTADILIGFLKFYGFTMNYVMKSINICNIENPLQWKNYTRCDNPYVDPLNPISDLQPKLVIIDPLNSGNNVGRATHRIKQIQMGFGIASTAIHVFSTCNKKRRCESYRNIMKCKIKEMQFKDNQRPCCIIKKMLNCTKRFLNERAYE